jgi:hypothetical protein
LAFPIERTDAHVYDKCRKTGKGNRQQNGCSAFFARITTNGKNSSCEGHSDGKRVRRESKEIEGFHAALSPSGAFFFSARRAYTLFILLTFFFFFSFQYLRN